MRGVPRRAGRAPQGDAVVRPDDWVAIVCGGRGGPPLGVGSEWVFKALDYVDRIHRLGCILEGGQSGIDAISRNWAKYHHRVCITHWANWGRFQRGGGPVRNNEMHAFQVRIADPSRRICLAFPGRDGTESMTSISLAGGVPVWRCELVDRDNFRWVEVLP